MSEKEERYVIFRTDNHHYIMNVDQSLWTHHVATAKTYTLSEAQSKFDEIELESPEYLVEISLLSKEMEWYRRNYG